MMRHVVLYLLTLAAVAIAEEALLFKVQEPQRGGGDNAEAQALAFAKSQNASGNPRIIELNADLLREGAVHVSLTGETPRRLEISRNREGGWSGKGEQDDRLALRVHGKGRYSGYAFFDGTMYSIVSVASGRSLVYEQPHSAACGADDLKHVKKGGPR